MSPDRIRLGKVLDALPQIEELNGLREILLDVPDNDAGSAGGRIPPYQPLDRRFADLSSLEERIPRVVDRERERVERTLRHVAEALRALAAGDEAEAAHRLIAAGEVDEAAWRLAEAERYYTKGLELGRRPRDRRAEGLALRRLARIARTRGHLRDALRLYGESHEISEAQRDVPGMVTSCLGVGNVHVDRGEWEAAREWYLRGIAAIGEAPTAEYLHFCNALSVVERRRGDLDASEAWLRRGEAVMDAVGDPSARHYLEHGRARLHLARGDTAAAIRVFRGILEQELDPIARISTLINLAEPLLQEGREREAESSLRQAEELALHYGAHRLLPHVYELLGGIAAEREDQDGLVFFEQALELIREHRLPAAQAATLQLAYGRFEAKLGHRESAAARFRMAREQFRSIGATLDETAAEEALAGLTTAASPPGADSADAKPNEERIDDV